MTPNRKIHKKFTNDQIIDSFRLLHLHSKMYGLNAFHPPALNIHQNISHEYSDYIQITIMIILYVYSFYYTLIFDAFLKIGSTSIIINYASRYFVIVRSFVCIYSIISDFMNSKKIWKIVVNFSDADQLLVSSVIFLVEL